MKSILTLIMILLLIGCSKEEKPITFSEGDNVIDINNDFFSFKGLQSEKREKTSSIAKTIQSSP